MCFNKVRMLCPILPWWQLPYSAYKKELVQEAWLIWTGKGRAIELELWFVSMPSHASLSCRTFIGWSSKRFRERNWHIGIPLILSGIGFM